ncbi:hemerythrin domain-containing protein [Azospirillum halopraeferens]|uniref:hemerythrin domain-containing protein n=1 Tax=Azospirillum halopraeferens TaxID=34010 RepID=UPI0004169020|nr:hemerythrin domain-containing protein [Azospirillum halopraeferens]
MTQEAVTGAYRRQHAEIDRLVASLLDLLNSPDAPQRLFDARALLTALDSAVDTHLTLEAQGLYPRLLAHADPDLRAAAARCREETSGLRPVFRSYVDEWTDISAIGNRFGTFRAETRAVLARLDSRMRREREELFPELDRLGW